MEDGLSDLRLSISRPAHGGDMRTYTSRFQLTFTFRAEKHKYYGGDVARLPV
jgi:hypothetical protein